MALAQRQYAALGRLEEIVRAHVSRRVKSRPAELWQLCPELRCVRDYLDPQMAQALTRRARDAGVGAERVAITRGVLDEESYARAFARSLGLPFEPLDGPVSRDQCPLTDKQLLEAPTAGLLPLFIGGELNYVIAPCHATARRMALAGGADPRLPGRARITTSDRLTGFVRRAAADTLSDHAADALRTDMPDLSAGPGNRWRTLVPAFLIAPFVIGAFIAAPRPSTLACEMTLAMLFLGWILLRIIGALIRAPGNGAVERVPDAELPTYTVLVALYRESAALEGLVSSLRHLDYPPEKLDIKLIVEPDDSETRQALDQLRLGPPFELFVASSGGPRTKPKALNTALPFARGTFTVIFDAEDRPEPDQLRRALDVFQRGGGALACVQGTLAIDNGGENWLTAMFAAEYAGLFDVFLPALSALGLPLPLGGSSNHFRTETLRAVGAWDPYNVTEDADLGLRLARFGYRAVAMESTTFEEAPARLGAWLRQRTRWFKGWMQTWLVHMRRPLLLRKKIGTGAFITVQLMVAGNVLAALIHPVLLVSLLHGLAAEKPIWDTPGESAIFAAVIVAGYLTSALLCLVGLARRRLMIHAWVLILMPLHWLLLALAAWRALFQLARNPYHWEKTEHVLARSVQRSTDEIIAEIVGAARHRHKTAGASNVAPAAPNKATVTE